MPQIRLITLDPGHFHAALIQKEMYPDVARRVTVYAPLGTDVAEHLTRIARFNSRAENPTSWELDIHCEPDFLERMIREKPGNVVVMSGRNRVKIDRIVASVEAGLNVLADKPWIIRSADMGKLEAALDAADRKGIVAYDIMTERYEITSILGRELVNDPAVFGTPVPGDEREPGVAMESVHHIMKVVAGAPNLRPAWFFDIREQGEALSDVGTHLVDLVSWTLFPGQAIDFRRDIRVLAGSRWPTVISRDQFRRVTGEGEFPGYLREHVKGDKLDYFCNNRVSYTIRGVHVRMNILWNWEAPHGDTYLAIFRGSKARVEIRQGKEENYRPEIYVVPVDKAETLAALKNRVAAFQKKYPGVELKERAGDFLIIIPERYRVGHEAHFAQVTNQFFEYLKDRSRLPAWEKPNMLAKYYVSTKGVELANK